jgi:hypothetical protein
MLAHQVPGSDIQLGARLLQGDSGAESSVEQKVPGLPAIQDIGGSTVDGQLRQRHIRRHVYNNSGQAVKSPGRDANDRDRVSVHHDLPPDHIWISVESFLPQVVAKNNNWVAVENLAFAAQEKPPRRRLHSKGIEEIAADIGHGDAFRLLPFDGKSIQFRCDRKHVAERVPALGAYRFEFRRGERTLQRPMVLAVGKRRDLLGICHRKRLEQE